MIIQNQIFYRQRKGLVPKGDLGVPNNTPKNSYGSNLTWIQCLLSVMRIHLATGTPLAPMVACPSASPERLPGCTECRAREVRMCSHIRHRKWHRTVQSVRIWCPQALVRTQVRIIRWGCESLQTLEQPNVSSKYQRSVARSRASTHLTTISRQQRSPGSCWRFLFVWDRSTDPNDIPLADITSPQLRHLRKQSRVISMHHQHPLLCHK